MRLRSDSLADALADTAADALADTAADARADARAVALADARADDRRAGRCAVGSVLAECLHRRLMHSMSAR